MSPLSSLPATSPNPFLIFARQNALDDARTTFSSWDNCMAKAYCKWPVIAAIIVASLILLSLILCIARFCCCGVECCCACCSCLNACCPSQKRNRRYEQAPQYPTPQPGYAYQAPMNYGYAQAPPPQFATFDASGSKGPHGVVTEDSLPAMPSWQTAQNRKVEDTSHHGADEAEKLKDLDGQGGIAMATLPAVGKRIKDDDALYEDPHDQRQPMLHPAVRDQTPQEYGYTAGEGSHGYAASSYQDSNAGDMSYRQPQHDYGNYAQQQHYRLDTVEARSPASVYSNAYPPTYHSRAPQISPISPPQQHAFPPASLAYGDNAPQRSFSPSQSTQYEPSELPAGRASQRPYEHPQYHELSSGASVSRMPTGPRY